MNEKKQEYRIGPGASSLLMIFVALCLTSVAILALVSAMADSNMTVKSQQMIDSYYTAAARVQREVSKVDAKLVEFRNSSPDKASYADKVFTLRDDSIGMTVQAEKTEDAALLSFSVPMHGGHEIFVQLYIPIEITGSRYLVTAHMVQNVTVWTPDDSMSLFNAGSFSSGDDEAVDDDDAVFEDTDDAVEDDETVEDDDDETEGDEPEALPEIGTAAQMTE